MKQIDYLNTLANFANRCKTNGYYLALVLSNAFEGADETFKHHINVISNHIDEVANNKPLSKYNFFLSEDVVYKPTEEDIEKKIV